MKLPDIPSGQSSITGVLTGAAVVVFLFLGFARITLRQKKQRIMKG